MASEKFELRLPEIPEKEPVSMAQVPREILIAMGRTIGGISTAERLAKMHSLEDFDLTKEARAWAEERLFAATEKWQKYNELLDHPMPHDSYGLAEMFPDLSETLMHLYQTATKDTNSNHPNTEILLVPYADMLKNIACLPEWLSRLREVSGLNEDHINRSIEKRLDDEEHVLQFTASGEEGLSFKDNLDYHIRHGGEWGILLVRDTQESDLSPTGHRSLEKGAVESHKFDHKSYGIAEWIADTLQRDPRSTRRIMLTGSKILLNSRPEAIAYGSFDAENQRYRLEIFETSTKPGDVDVVPTYGVV